MSEEQVPVELIEWHRLHKVTPLLNAWKVAVALSALLLWQGADDLQRLNLAATTVLLIIGGTFVLGALLGLGFSALAWSRMMYGIADDSVFLHSGVLFRQQRHVRLDRLQTIDVTQPLLARVTGFAALKIESAGGSGSNLTLAFLKEADAQELRNALLARAAGVAAPTAANADPATAPVPTPEAPEQELYALTANRLVGSLLRSGAFYGVLILVIGVIVAVAVTQTIHVLFAAAPAIGVGTYFWSRFAGEFNFRVATSPDGIRVRQGLLETKARTVPPGRVQAIQLTQSLLWRSKGWWRITINIAGYEQSETVGTVLYPVATEAEAVHLLSLVHRDFGDPRPLEVFHAGLVGSGTDEGFLHTPQRARWLDPWTWQRVGVRLTETATLMRTGRFWRALTVVPHERVQSLALQQGPLERCLNLVTLAAHSTPGGITPRVHHQDADAIRDVLATLTERARAARKSAGPERWMARGQQVDAQAVRATYAGVYPASPRVH